MKYSLFFITIFLIVNTYGQNNLTSLAPIPTERNGQKAVAFGGEIYVIGGNNSGVVEIYNPSQNAWRQGKQLEISNCSWCGLDSSDNKIYGMVEIGGEAVYKLIIVEYDPLNDSWKRIDSISSNLTTSTYKVVNNRCYIAGGYIFKNNQYLNQDSLYIYDINEKKWSVGVNMPDRRHAGFAAANDSLMYVFNGVGDCLCLTDVLPVNIYNTKTNSWIAKPRPPFQMAYQQGCILNGKINFFGWGGSLAATRGLTYNTNNNRWATAQFPSLPFITSCIINFENKIYIFGGSDSKSTYVYDPNPSTEVGLKDIDKYSYNLEQNYPNPFNPFTRINYSIANSESVTLKVFDAIGNEVATLINKEQPAGNHFIDFEASSLSSGIYIYEIKAGAFTKARKFLVLK